MPFILNHCVLLACHFGAYSFSFCHTFYVTNSSLIYFFGSYILNLPNSCGYQHNNVFQKLLKLMNQRPVIDLCWGLEGAEPLADQAPMTQAGELGGKFRQLEKTVL